VAQKYVEFYQLQFFLKIFSTISKINIFTETNRQAMSEICRNCAQEITLNFCANCGQKKFRRVDAKYLKEELQYTLLHTNKGFFYTVKRLMQNPGRTVREFLEGNRVNHYKPILLLFVLMGIYVFLMFSLFDLDAVYGEYMRQTMPKNATNGQLEAARMSSQIMVWGTKHQTLIMMCLIPVVSGFTWFFFRKWGHNFYEHVIINAFLNAAVLVLTVLFLIPIQYFLRNQPLLFGVLPAALSALLTMTVFVWMYKGLYPEKPVAKIIWRSAGMVLSMMAMMTLLMILAGAALVAVKVIGG
jgi:hypothetical protein